MTSKNPLHIWRIDDDERYTRQPDGRYTMDNTRMGTPFRYLLSAFADEAMFTDIPPDKRTPPERIRVEDLDKPGVKALDMVVINRGQVYRWSGISWDNLRTVDAADFKRYPVVVHPDDTIYPTLPAADKPQDKR